MIQSLMLWLLQASEPCNTTEWSNGDWYRCTFEPAVASVGEPIVGILTGGTVVLSLYVAGGGLAAPAVVTLLLAAAMLPLLPGGMVGIAFGVAFVGLVATLISVGQRYVLDQGVP